MDTTDTLVIGAGQAGLAISRCLTDRGVDHVVLERGQVAERWRTDCWDSLRLITPNWMSRLPGWSYDGPDPDGFMSAAEVVRHFERYSVASTAPVCERTAVESLRFDGDRYHVATSTGTWQAANVVIATGWCDRPRVPPIARYLSPGIHQVAATHYRNPSRLPDGGVLVVGASATGVQLADELRTAGREVVLSAGRHARLPRRYRGMDIYWWLDRIGTFDRTIDETPDQRLARRQPSPQLVGGPDGRCVDLTTLQTAGVHLTGRLVAADGHVVAFADDLAGTAAAAQRHTDRVLDDIDAHIGRAGLSAEVLAAEPTPRLHLRPAPTRLDLRAARIGSVIWATGHRRDYPWLEVPVLDSHGEIAQRRGVTASPGLYVLGQRFQHYRSSNLIDGVGRDATFVADHVACRVRVC